MVQNQPEQGADSRVVTETSLNWFCWQSVSDYKHLFKVKFPGQCPVFLQLFCESKKGNSFYLLTKQYFNPEEVKHCWISARTILNQVEVDVKRVISTSIFPFFILQLFSSFESFLWLLKGFGSGPVHFCCPRGLWHHPWACWPCSQVLVDTSCHSWVALQADSGAVP